MCSIATYNGSYVDDKTCDFFQTILSYTSSHKKLGATCIFTSCMIVSKALPTRSIYFYFTVYPSLPIQNTP